MERASSIEALEPDQVLKVLEFLPVKTVLLFGMTCHNFHNLTNSEALWSSICAREWGHRAVEALHHHHNGIAAADAGGWKRLFQQMNSLSSGHWQRIHQSDILPVARASHSMSSVGNRILVFGGGHQGGRHLDDTWIGLLSEKASSMEWQQLSAEHHPSGRFGHSSVLVEDKLLILFGGMDDKGIKQSDIWAFRNLSTSHHHHPPWELLELMEESPMPPPRGAHAGSYAGAGKLVVFGGIGLDGGRLGDTWLLNMSASAATWHQMVTLESPAPRSGHTLTWIGGQRLVLFGGRGSNQQLLDDLWMLDLEGSHPRWIQLKSSEIQPGCKHPAPRSGHSATLIANGKVLVYGGENAKRTRKCGIWLLDIAAAGAGLLPQEDDDEFSSCRSRKLWTKLRPQGDVPSKRSFHGACSVAGGRAVLIFGGMVDGEVVPRAATGLQFDSELYLLQFLP